MSVDERYHGLVKSIRSAALAQDIGEQDLLKMVADAYGLSHVAYIALHAPGWTGDEPLVCVTYPESWIANYRTRRLVQFDPAIHQSLRSVLPTDWASFPLHAKKIRSLFGEAKEFGIGAQGMTFPIRSRAGGTALFSISSSMPASEWRDLTREYLPNLQMLAFYIHQAITGPTRADDPVVRLSPREAECLKWAALGKTCADIGEILSLSERTVRCYMNLARHKLNCLNITHAVARAIMLDLIPPPP